MILLNENSWEIKKTSNKGRGIFTKKAIPPGIVTGDYLGKVLRTATEDTSDKNGLYLMYYSDQASIYPTDINAPGIHLLNHSCTPNCWLYTYKGHTLVFTLRHIFPGEELTISYLLSPDEFCNPCSHRCSCNSINCTGTMHLTKEQFSKWSKFSEDPPAGGSKKTKKMPINYGKELPKLTSYPKLIPDNPIYTLFGTAEQPSLVRMDKKLLSVKELRKLIRETGLAVEFPSFKTKVLGVENNQITFEQL